MFVQNLWESLRLELEVFFFFFFDINIVELVVDEITQQQKGMLTMKAKKINTKNF